MDPTPEPKKSQMSEHDHDHHREERPAYAIPVRAAWTFGATAMAVVASGAGWMTTMSSSNALLERSTREMGLSFDKFIEEMRLETRENREAIAEVRASSQTRSEAMANREIIMSQIRELDRSLTRVVVVIEQQTNVLERLARGGTIHGVQGERP